MGKLRPSRKQLIQAYTVSSLQSKAVPRTSETGICVPEDSLGRRGWDRLSSQLALDDTGEISFHFYTLWTQSHWVWNSLTVRHILGQPAKSFALFIMYLFMEKELLLEKNFLPHRTSWSSRLAFKPGYVNPADQMEPLLLHAQKQPFWKEKYQLTNCCAQLQVHPYL